MIYFFKAMASFILPPGIFILIIFLLAIALLRQKKYFLGILTFLLSGVFYCSSIFWFSDALVRDLEYRYPLPKFEKVDAIIMLGGGALQAAPDLSGPGAAVRGVDSRINLAFRLHKRFNIPIVLAGGPGIPGTGCEAEIYTKIFIDMGVAKEMLLLDDFSRNTIENAENVTAILRQHDWQNLILITSAYHMPRAVACFESQGITVIPCPTDYLTNPERFSHYLYFCPSSEAFNNTVIALREHLRLYVMQTLGI